MIAFYFKPLTDNNEQTEQPGHFNSLLPVFVV